MANHCFNFVTIKGSKRLLPDIEFFLRWADGRALDYNSAADYPQQFRIADEVNRLLLLRVNSVPRDGKSIRSKFLNGYRDGYNKGGYEWCVANWGVKWNAFETIFNRRPRSLYYEFTSPWGPPVIFLGRLSLIFPEASIHLAYDVDGERGTADYVAGEER